MPTVVQFRRGTTAQNNAFTGASGEITVDTTLGTIRVHNGLAGGNTLASIDAVQTLSNKTLSSPSVTGTLSSSGLINTSGNIICASISAGTYVGLSSNKINNNASNVTVDTSWVNVAVNGSNVAAFGATGLVLSGNLTVQGTTTTVNSTTVDIADLNITVAKGAASAAAANGGGLTVDGASATLLYTSATDSWNINKAVGVNSGSANIAIINLGTNGVGNIGSSGATFNTVFAKATTAQYADLAENYTSDQDYAPGTVLVFGGEAEVTQSTASHDTRIAGVVSTNPAYLMNGAESGIPVALQGRVPCQVLGPVAKGDRLVASQHPGIAQRLNKELYEPGCIIGKALESIDSTAISTIEVVVGRV